LDFCIDQGKGRGTGLLSFCIDHGQGGAGLLRFLVIMDRGGAIIHFSIYQGQGVRDH
jgi:hypothetical protein